MGLAACGNQIIRQPRLPPNNAGRPMRQFKCPLAWLKSRNGSPTIWFFFSWGGSQREGCINSDAGISPCDIYIYTYIYIYICVYIYILCYITPLRSNDFKRHMLWANTDFFYSTRNYIWKYRLLSESPFVQPTIDQCSGADNRYRNDHCSLEPSMISLYMSTYIQEMPRTALIWNII